MPYVGIGFSPALNNRWGLSFQVGAFYAGEAELKLSPVNANLNTTDSTGTTTIGEALDAEVAKFKNENSIEWLPAAKLGLHIRF